MLDPSLFWIVKIATPRASGGAGAQYSAMGRRRAAAHGDSRPPDTGDTGTGGSATGDKVEDVESATAGKGKGK